MRRSTRSRLSDGLCLIMNGRKSKRRLLANAKAALIRPHQDRSLPAETGGGADILVGEIDCPALTTLTFSQKHATGCNGLADR